jgi:hypothetical protein
MAVGAPDLPNFDYSRFLSIHGAARCDQVRSAAVP